MGFTDSAPRTGHPLVDCFRLFDPLLGRMVDPLRTITVETINGDDAGDSTYLEVLLKRFDTVVGGAQGHRLSTVSQLMGDLTVDIQGKFQLPLKPAVPGDRKPSVLSLKAGDRMTAAVLEVTNGTDALLSFGIFKAYARLPVPVATGQTVQLGVESSGNTLRMVIMVPTTGQGRDVPAAEPLPVQLFEPVSDQPFLAAHAKALTPGDMLQGRITGFEKNGHQLVDFGKFKVFVNIDMPVRQGQVVPLTVLKNDSGLSLAAVVRDTQASASVHPSPFSATGVAPGVQAEEARQTATPAAAVMKGTVRQSLKAQGMPLGSVGASPPTSVEMALLRDMVHHLLDGTIRPSNAGPMSFPATLEKTLVNLQQALNPASTSGDIGALVSRIRDFVENSGIYFEKRLEEIVRGIQGGPQPLPASDLSTHPAVRELMVKDLKPNLLILKHFLDTLPPDLKSADRHMLETVKSVVERAISHIDQQQLTATQKPVDPGLLQAFSHLLFLFDNPRNARLKVYYSKKGRDDAHKNPRVSLILEMDRMGAVRTDLWAVGKDLNITFFVQEAKIKAEIDAEHHRVSEMLKTSFDTVAIGVVVSEKKIAEFDGENLSIPHRRQVDLSV